MLSLNEIRRRGKKPATSPLHAILQEISFLLTKFFLFLPFTPNQITLFWAFLQVFACLLLLKGTYLYFVVGVTLFQFCKILDSVDGQVARIRNKTSLLGIYLDSCAHNITNPLLFICLTLGVFKMTGQEIYLVIGSIGVISYWYTRIVSINPLWFKKLKQKKFIVNFFSYNLRSKRIWIYDFLKPQYPFNLLFFGIIFNFTPYILIIYSGLFFVEMIKRVVSVIVRIKRVEVKYLEENNKAK